MIRFVVFGSAQPAGSKRAFYNPKLGRAMVVDANPKAREWKDRIAAEAGKAMQGRTMFTGPLSCTFVFYRPRPASHYGTGRRAGIVKPGAPEYPISAPDTLKLTRGAEDALQGIVYANDAQLVTEEIAKRYGEPARVEILIWQLGSQQLGLAQAEER